MNHLSGETSPYLRQHADNPVEWFPWCVETLNVNCPSPHQRIFNRVLKADHFQICFFFLTLKNDGTAPT
jgi:hypothetical protein